MASLLTSQFSKLNLTQSSIIYKTCAQVHTQCCPLLFRASQQLWAEPMKKKKRIDPAMIAAREAKRIRKIEKEIKRLTKFGRTLKPVEEIEMTNKKLLLARERKRDNPALSCEESNSRIQLHKEWSLYRTNQWFKEYQIKEKVVLAQQEALQELKAESEELYTAALQIDYGFVPVEFEGPKLTPPIKGYTVPDGEYVDTTRKY